MAVFSKEDSVHKVVTIIAEKLNIDKNRITLDATLQSLGADSLDIAEIIMRMEEQLNIAIDDAQAEKLHTVEDVISYVHELRNK